MRFDVDVPADGRIELQLPQSTVRHVTVYVVDEKQDLAELAEAATSSMGFWDNPHDDKDWNDA
jgi:hypothetical protein